MKTIKPVIKTQYIDLNFDNEEEVIIHLERDQNIKPGSIPDHVKKIKFMNHCNLDEDIIGPNVTHLWVDTWKPEYVVPSTVKHLFVFDARSMTKLPDVENIYIHFHYVKKYTPEREYFMFLYSEYAEGFYNKFTEYEKYKVDISLVKSRTVFDRKIKTVKMIKKEESLPNPFTITLEDDETIIYHSIPEYITGLNIIREGDQNKFKKLDDTVFQPNIETVVMHSFDVHQNLPSTIKCLYITEYGGQKLPDIKNITVHSSKVNLVPKESKKFECMSDPNETVDDLKIKLEQMNCKHHKPSRYETFISNGKKYVYALMVSRDTSSEQSETENDDVPPPLEKIPSDLDTRLIRLEIDLIQDKINLLDRKKAFLQEKKASLIKSIHSK